MDNSTIAGISTPAGSGGIGIIKISGPDAIDVALAIFLPISSQKDFKNTCNQPDHKRFLKSRHFYYGHIVDPGTNRIMDEVLLVVMRAPYSYTAEDVVEIQAHAGPLVLKSILNVLLDKGVRLADPGEFTKRAFLNGRIDLTQAESIIEIINARSAGAIDIAMAQLSGEFKQIIDSIQSALIDIVSIIEASIDFPDEVDDAMDVEALIVGINEKVILQIRNLIQHFEDENYLREGLKVVIVGGPNVGKSSLMNRLINKERSIVTDIPGTTRDFIEDSFITKGVPIIVTDTAGMHDDPDPVERIGIEKAWGYISTADIILFTVDTGKIIQPTDITLFEKFSDKKIIVVINKSDLSDEKLCFTLPSKMDDLPCVKTSALFNQGIDDLKDMIAKIAFESATETGHKIVPNLRQKIALEKALGSMVTAADGLGESVPLELVSIDLKSALDMLSEITGETTKPDILENIFSRFCIGK